MKKEQPFFHNRGVPPCPNTEAPLCKNTSVKSTQFSTHVCLAHSNPENYMYFLNGLLLFFSLFFLISFCVVWF